MNNDEKKVTLDDELLEEVSGGVIQEKGRELILRAMARCKKSGKTKEECKALIRKNFMYDYIFRINYTDNTSADLEEAIDIIEKNW